MGGPERSPQVITDHEPDATEISVQDRLVGRAAYDLFTKEIIRPLPWDIKDGIIEIYRKPDAKAKLIIIPGEPYIPDMRERVIITTGLEHETISPTLAGLLAQFKLVEDSLPDYMGRSTQITRNNIGINMSYNQWGREELQHSLALGLILEATGNKTSDEIKDDYQANLKYLWTPPFTTARQMILYAAFQEINTGLNYEGLARRAKEEEAPIVAKILKLIAADERYHGSGYRRFGQLYFKQDPKGTLADAVHVGKNFRMPIGNFTAGNNPFRALIEVGAYDRDTLPIKTIQKTLKLFEFVPDEQISEVVAGYRKKPKKVST